MKRASPGILYMSQMIPIDSTTPTIMKLLYFFSHLCARDPIPRPETDAEGIPIYLRRADKTTSAAPKIPNPYTLEPRHVPMSTVVQVLVDHHVITPLPPHLLLTLTGLTIFASLHLSVSIFIPTLMLDARDGVGL